MLASLKIIFGVLLALAQKKKKSSVVTKMARNCFHFLVKDKGLFLKSFTFPLNSPTLRIKKMTLFWLSLMLAINADVWLVTGPSALLSTAAAFPIV